MATSFDKVTGMKKNLIKTTMKVNDNVIIITGADRGKRGKLLFIDRKNGKIIIEGINKKEKKMKPNQEHPKGGVIKIERPIDISNVMYFCDKCKKGVKISVNISEKAKTRVCKKCNKSIA